MNRLVALAAVATLIGCAVVPQGSTPQLAMTPAEQAIVTKCGAPPTPEPGGIGRGCGAIVCPPESNAHFQQRQAIYALCSRDDPSYPAVLAEFIKATSARQQS